MEEEAGDGEALEEEKSVAEEAIEAATEEDTNLWIQAKMSEFRF